MARSQAGRPTNSADVRNARQVQGGTVDRYPTRLGWWERREFPARDDDITVVVLPREDRRPDLIANRIYGNAQLAWVVLQFNNIVDVETELRVTTEIRLPSRRRLTLDILNQSTGGNRIR